MQGHSRGVEFTNPAAATTTLEPGPPTPEVARRPNNRYPLHGAVPKFDVHLPFVGREVNQSRPSETDHRVSDQRFLKRPHAVQNMHIEGLKMLNSAVGSHRMR